MFISAGVRLWKPMMEEMYMEETKDPDIISRASSDGDFDDSIGWPNQNPSSADQKPTPDQLAQIDSECLSYIISSPDKNDSNNEVSSKAFQSHHLLHDHQGFGAFGAVELDFSSYDHHAPGRASYANHDQSCASNRNFDGRGGGVSLTLGLQQNGVSGVSLPFSPASQSSLFFARDHVEDCQPVQYSLLDGEGQNLPDRNLDHETVEDMGEIDCKQERGHSGKDDNWDPGENVQAYMRKAGAHHSSEEDLINSPGLNDRMSKKWDFELTDPIRGSTGKLLMQLVEKAIDLFWDACPSRSLSLNFRAEILLVLNLTRYNDAQLWMGQQDLVSLKQVDLSYSSLIMLPDLSKASNLWSLNLQGCINLVEVSSIQFLINLEYLNLNGCKSLQSLPSMMALRLLCSLHLSGCSKIRRLPLSIGCLSGLIVLDIRNCKRLQNLPISTSRLKSIQNLNISGCSNLMKHLSGSGMEKATQSVMGSSLFMSESIINPGSYISSNSSSDDISVRPQNNEILCPSRTPEEGKSSEVKVLEDPLSVTAASPLGRTEGIEEFLVGEPSESLNQLVAQHCQKRCLESFMGDSSNTASFEETPLVRRRISSESGPLSSSTTKEKESTELEGGIKSSSVFLEPSLARNETRLSKGLVQISPSKNLQSEEQENRAKETVLPRPLAIKTCNECAAYLNSGFSLQRKALESYMDMPVEAIHEADAYEDIRRILDVMIQQTSDLKERTNLEDIMSFLEELNENIPDTVTCLRSSRTHRTLLQLKLTCLDVSLVEGQEQYTSLEAKLATISQEEAKLDTEIQLLMAKKEELSKEHQTAPN